MPLSIHLHDLHLDAQYGHTCHLLTQLRSGERTGCQLLWSTTLLLPTLLSDSQVSISLIIHGLWRTVSRHKAHAVLTCTNGVSPNHLPVIVASNRPWTTLSTRVHQQNLKADWIYSTKQMMTQSYCWNLQQLQHARNKQIVIMWCWCFRDGPRVGYRTTQSYFWICQRRWWNDHTLWESQER